MRFRCCWRCHLYGVFPEEVSTFFLPGKPMSTSTIQLYLLLQLPDIRLQGIVLRPKPSSLPPEHNKHPMDVSLTFHERIAAAAGSFPVSGRPSTGPTRSSSLPPTASLTPRRCSSSPPPSTSPVSSFSPRYLPFMGSAHRRCKSDRFRATASYAHVLPSCSPEICSFLWHLSVRILYIFQ